MAKRKAIQFVPLGRPPKVGECYIGSGESRGVYVRSHDTYDASYSGCVAVERREVEVEVEEPVPEWIGRAFIATGGVPCSTSRAIAAAFRAHVEAALAATERRFPELPHNVVSTLIYAKEELLK